MSLNKLIYQTKEIRALEQLAVPQKGLSEGELMQQAARAAFDFMMSRWPETKSITVFCGSGHNGGDGYCLALLAHQQQLNVAIYQVGNQTTIKPLTQKALDACKGVNIPIHVFQENTEVPTSDIYVDAILGMGLTTTLRPEIINAIEKLQHLSKPILALDVPTGINSDTGQVMGAAVHASATITFIGLKLGLLTGYAPAYTGEIALSLLNINPELFNQVTPVAEVIQISQFAKWLLPRPKDWHKGRSGHVLIIGGELGYSGAPRMAGEAALRIGAGLVTIATRPEHAVAMNLIRPELMCRGVESTHELAKLVEKADVIIIGPGLAQTKWSHMLWDYCNKLDLPLVVDADALNLLAQNEKNKSNWILTPHPGEAGRLLKIPTATVQDDRLQAVLSIQQRYGGVAVLKGVGTLVSAPDELTALCDKGNPGMGTAGMGDVLTGILGGLIGQGIPLDQAAKLGVCLHALAGDLAAKQGQRGMLAMDLMPHLRTLMNP